MCGDACSAYIVHAQVPCPFCIKIRLIGWRYQYQLARPAAMTKSVQKKSARSVAQQPPKAKRMSAWQKVTEYIADIASHEPQTCTMFYVVAYRNKTEHGINGNVADIAIFDGGRYYHLIQTALEPRTIYLGNIERDEGPWVGVDRRITSATKICQVPHMATLLRRNGHELGEENVAKFAEMLNAYYDDGD